MLQLCSARRDWFFENSDGLKLEVISLEVEIKHNSLLVVLVYFIQPLSFWLHQNCAVSVLDTQEVALHSRIYVAYIKSSAKQISRLTSVLVFSTRPQRSQYCSSFTELVMEPGAGRWRS